MRRWRYAKNRDKKHALIVAALRAVGATVEAWESDSRKGLPDLVVGHHGETVLLEVKAPLGKEGGKSKDGQHLSVDQDVWHKCWKGGRCVVVRSPEEAVTAVTQLKLAGVGT